MKGWRTARAAFCADPHACLQALEKSPRPRPQQLDQVRDRCLPASAKDDSRDAEALASALKTDQRCFRRLEPLDPIVVELWEWSRIAEDLRDDRSRLGNRVRELVWCYYRQMLDLTDYAAAPWFLELWASVPTPDTAARVRESAVERLLKKYRICRFSAAEAIERLRAPELTVASGTVSAATDHLASVAKRLQLVNRQIAVVDDRLDRLTARLAETAETEPGQASEQHDVTILAGVAPVATQHDTVSRAKDTALRTRGHNHAHALRSVTDRLLALGSAMLTTRKPFNASHATIAAC